MLIKALCKYREESTFTKEWLSSPRANMALSRKAVMHFHHLRTSAPSRMHNKSKFPFVFLDKTLESLFEIVEKGSMGEVAELLKYYKIERQK